MDFYMMDSCTVTILCIKFRIYIIFHTYMIDKMENKKAIKHYGKVKILDEIEIFDKNNWYKSFLGKKLSKSFKNFQ